MSSVVICSPSEKSLSAIREDYYGVLLYDRPTIKGLSYCGAQIKDYVQKRKLSVNPIAWDFLTIALSVIAADTIVLRNKSSDGWTRQIRLKISVYKPTVWKKRKHLLEKILRFLTSDIWVIDFISGGESPPKFPETIEGENDSVALLSGGLDSLVGVIDLVVQGLNPLAVSQIVRGDRQRQEDFSNLIGISRHFQFTNSLRTATKSEKSQRARSLLFIAYGILSACSLRNYIEGHETDLYICENGLISINPSLTSARLGSLSTRTTHPIYLGLLQSLLDSLELKVNLVNPYQLKTKGEMLSGCADQKLLTLLAHQSTSCSRFLRYSHSHCGRCVPCLIRRGAFKRWGKPDRTEYVYKNLGLRDSKHAFFDDVRSMAMAITRSKEKGINSLVGASLLSPIIDDPVQFESVVDKGLIEIESLLLRYKIKC